jgi:signal transduction histidine kinase
MPAPPYSGTVGVVARPSGILGLARGVDPFKADIGLALAFVAFALIESLIAPGSAGRAATAVASTLAVAGLAWRRRAPLLASAWLAAFTVGEVPFEEFLVFDRASVFVATVVLLYTLGRHTTGRTLLAGVALLIGAVWVKTEPLLGELAWVLLIMGPSVLAGRAMRSRALLQRELREKARAEEAQRERRARDAVEAERERIAAELRAVVMSGLNAMVVQAEAVPRVIAAGDTLRAVGALATIEETGRDSLAEMRRLLGVLRREGARPALAPQPSLAHPSALLERARADGLETSLAVEGAPRPLPPGIDLTASRIVQEALAAAGGEGAVSAEVLLRYGPRDVTVSVRDDRSRDAPEPAQLAAMRDRLGIYGGTLRSGRTPTGGLELIAKLPHREGAAS